MYICIYEYLTITCVTYILGCCIGLLYACCPQGPPPWGPGPPTEGPGREVSTVRATAAVGPGAARCGAQGWRAHSDGTAAAVAPGKGG